MNNYNKRLYINGDIWLTKFNASIVLDDDETWIEIIEFLGILKTYFDTPEYIFNTAILILKISWPHYRESFNRIHYESIVIAALMVSYNFYEKDPDRDLYKFMEKCFHKEDVVDRLYEVERSEIEIKDHISLRPVN